TRLVLQGPDPFQRQVGRQVLEAYGRYHRAEFEAFFNRGLVLGLLQRGYGELSNRDPAILDYIQTGLRLIMSCPSVLELFELLQVEALRLVCERPAPPLCARLCQLLGDFPQCLPRGRKLSLAFCQQLVRSIAHFQSQGSREAELRLYVSQVTQVSGLLRSVWKAEPDTLLPSLQELFAVISATDTSFEPSVALASLVQHIPLQMITVLIRSLTTDPNVKDASMTQALCRMIDWLSWPLAQHVETWVIALLKGLAAVQKFTILIDVTLLKIELVFNRLWFPLVRPGALAVLSHMLLSFQHSPEAFHLIVPHVVSLVHSFKRDGLPSSTTFLIQLTELIHCMIYHYSGFPELYEPILEAVKDMPKPTEEKIKVTLGQSAWTSQSSSLLSSSFRPFEKSETGKTGLINLGNTCYMNSVLQALFMATDFRRHILSLNLNGSDLLVEKLQRLFAFLTYTQREAYAPKTFFEASRPSWFSARSQQDCSEYLKFLLNRLHEEERTLKTLSAGKDSESKINEGSKTQEAVNRVQVLAESSDEGSEEKTLIEMMFGGKLKMTIRCFNCKSVSQREEAFTDLSLAFCPPTSLENVGPKRKGRSEAKGNKLMQTKTSTRPAREAPLKLEENDGCDPKLKEGTTKHSSAEPKSENTKNSEPKKVQDKKKMSQRVVDEPPLSVIDLLNYFLEPEILSGDNKYYCGKCAFLQDAEKTMQIIEAPEYLILTLVRFAYDPKCHVRRKILDNVSLPLDLKLPVKAGASSQGVVSGGWPVDVEVSDSGENIVKKLKASGTSEMTCTKLEPYVLNSVVVHSGLTSESGHYYSYTRNDTGLGPSGPCLQSTAVPLVSPQDNVLTGESPTTVENDTDMSREWLLFNDSRVTFTSFQSIQKITNTFPKDTAYVLFYKKQSSTNSANGDPPLQKDLMDAIVKDNKLYLQEQELSARTQALQAASASCCFRPNGFDDNDPPGSCGPAGGGGGGGFSTVGRLVF
ncbi:UBP38 hydrolase, partial [Psophia crepitans]|nr:UBP38 hydrolase [Psophia crepitans]